MITVVGPFALVDDLKWPEAVIIRSPAHVWPGADAGYAGPIAGIALADIKSPCQRLAAQLIGRSDPTAAGYLATATSVSPVAAQSSRSANHSTSSATSNR